MTYDFNNGMGEDPQYKDKADFFGSEDASLEMGVIAVGCMVIAWLFFKALFPWVVTASLLILAYRVFRGQTTIPALWERIRLLPGKLAHVFRSTKIVFEIRRVPEDVLDVTLLRDSLFVLPPRCVEHQQTRDAFVRVAAMKPVFGVLPDSDAYAERNRYMLLLASTIAQLEYWGDDPIGPIRERRWKPPTAPKLLAAPKADTQIKPLWGAVAAAGGIDIKAWIIIALSGALVTVGGIWQLDRWGKQIAEDKLEKVTQERDDAQKSARANYDNAVIQAQSRARETAAAREELEKSRALAESAQGRAQRLQAREKKQNEQAIDGLPADLDQRLRERLAEPAAAAEPPSPGADSDRPAG